MNVRREITLPAPASAVYRAWLEPEILRRWLAPGSSECTRAEVDERVGGSFRIWQEQDGRPIGGFDAEILELVPDRRIVWRWGMTGPESEQMFDSTLTVTLEDTPDGGTQLRLTHERLDQLAAAMPEVAAQFGAGWEDVLHKLAVVVKQ
ncbi:uncharacterized protein YndB with AHSA1/START domain [Actinoplanes tereljensis]|uniref:Activator of Hsp90 ATPase homologue 1/2-like C-terminal domain-containing protein n=1 Tax=Paractinoplanes tereljensis TaxID=571912 RepID=A0A919NH11_9ACTN|nr:SRPBCC domain-containing protein [Actinoplanes tereljensis]GIF18466.1 hypothetical protein Ate02nite_11960 [Actinoplanes tereljensis]